MAALGRDHGISRSIPYRYLNEMLEVLATRALELHYALATAAGDWLLTAHP